MNVLFVQVIHLSKQIHKQKVIFRFSFLCKRRNVQPPGLLSKYTTAALKYIHGHVAKQKYDFAREILIEIIIIYLCTNNNPY